jgi:hypothetical protein
MTAAAAKPQHNHAQGDTGPDSRPMTNKATPAQDSEIIPASRNQFNVTDFGAGTAAASITPPHRSIKNGSMSADRHHRRRSPAAQGLRRGHGIGRDRSARVDRKLPFAIFPFLKSFHPIPYIARPCYDEPLYWPIVADTSGRAAGHFRCRASD